MSAFLRDARLTAASLRGFVLWSWWYGNIGLPKLERVGVTTPAVVGRTHQRSSVGWESLSGRKSPSLSVLGVTLFRCSASCVGFGNLHLLRNLFTSPKLLSLLTCHFSRYPLFSFYSL